MLISHAELTQILKAIQANLVERSELATLDRSGRESEESTTNLKRARNKIVSLLNGPQSGFFLLDPIGNGRKSFFLNGKKLSNNPFTRRLSNAKN